MFIVRWIHERNYLPKIPPGNNHADGIKAVELFAKNAF